VTYNCFLQAVQNSTYGLLALAFKYGLLLNSQQLMCH
jgi:hypothetical protein